MVREFARFALAAQGLVIKHVDAAKVRIAIAAVHAAAADAVLVAHHLPKLGAQLVAARPVQKIAWRQEARERKMLGGGDAEMLPQQVINNSEAAQQER
jgi:hypothetical protein